MKLKISIQSPNTEIHWDQMMDLRFDVLRKPWNQPKGSEIAADDLNAIHGIIIHHDRVIGTCRSHLNSTTEAQFRFMAISPEFQGKGLGKELLEYMEVKTKQTYPETSKIILHARDLAVPFYTSMNYKVVSPSYLLFGIIQHFLMEKII